MSLKTRPIWFLHVTKCGGTSLRTAIMNSLMQEEAHRAELHLHDAVTSSALASATEIDTFRLRDVMLAYELKQPNRRFVAGHFRYTRSLHEPLMAGCVPVTLLRDPVERFLSLFYYNHFKVTDYGKEFLSLEEYVLRPRARRSAEDYVRLFRGTGGPHRRFADASDIILAIENLKRFAVVGVLENLPAFMTSLELQAGIRISMPLQNQSPAPVGTRHQQIDTALLDRIRNLCEPSMELYLAALDISGNSTDS